MPNPQVRVMPAARSLRRAGTGSRIAGMRTAEQRRPSGHESSRTTIVVVAEFIYSMQRVRKAHGDKVILDNVTLNFLPGAKIGVVGPNGAGKSTVLKIMAGLEHPNNGDAILAPGATVGILQQEPPL